MLDIEFIRNNTLAVKQAAKNKGFQVDIDRLLELDKERRELIKKVEDLRHQKKSANKEIVQALGAEKNKKIAAMKQVDNDLDGLEAKLEKVDAWYKEIMYTVPNVPHTKVPVGKSEEDNVLIRKYKQPTEFNFEPKDHITLGKELDIIDIERGVKLTGNRGYFLKKDGARLEFALMQYALDFLRLKGFTIMNPPFMAYDEFFYGTGFFPWSKAETFRTTDGKKEQNLIGTAEIPLTSYHANEVLQESDIPKMYCAYTPCFRTEVGSYGRDTKGLYRIRQFSKVEQVILCKNSDSESQKMFQFILSNSEEFLKTLDIPFRLMQLCTGDMGPGQIEKIDIESWMPSRKAYGETHSCSRFGDFQSRRLNIRYKDSEGKIQYVHTLNNTLIASPRILIPLLEVHQREDGKVNIPKALQPYMGGQTTIG